MNEHRTKTLTQKKKQSRPTRKLKINAAPCKPVYGSCEGKRRVFCRHYNRCLDHAVARNWAGFSCEGCQSYETVQWESAQWDEDRIRCMLLIYSVISELSLRVGGNDISCRMRE